MNAETVYSPILSALERTAYQAAHEILNSWNSSVCATPGGRRTELVDKIAEIVMRHCGEAREA